MSALFEIESHCRAKSVLEHTMQPRLQIHSNRLVPAFKVLGFQVEVTRPGSQLQSLEYHWSQLQTQSLELTNQVPTPENDTSEGSMK